MSPDKKPHAKSRAGFRFVPEPPQSETYSKYLPAIKAAFEQPEQWILLDTTWATRGGPENVRRKHANDVSENGLTLEWRINQVLNDPHQERPYYQLFLRAVLPPAQGPGPRGAGELGSPRTAPEHLHREA